MGANHDFNIENQLHWTTPKNWRIRTKFSAHDGDKTQLEVSIVRGVGGRSIGSVKIRELAGCCGVLVVYYLRPNEAKEVRAIKSFQAIHLWIAKAAKKAGYGALMYTQTSGSIGYKALTDITKVHVEPNGAFVNGKTGNIVSAFFWTLKQKTKQKLDFGDE